MIKIQRTNHFVAMEEVVGREQKRGWKASLRGSGGGRGDSRGDKRRRAEVGEEVQKRANEGELGIERLLGEGRDVNEESVRLVLGTVVQCVVTG